MIHRNLRPETRIPLRTATDNAAFLESETRQVAGVEGNVRSAPPDDGQARQKTLIGVVPKGDRG
jgi:hypothetical protein